MATDPQTPGESLKQITDLDLFERVNQSIDEMVSGANELNKVFGGINRRMSELQNTVADATKGIFELGGSMDDVNRTLQEISLSTRRNIAASAEDSAKLFASQQVLGQSVSTLVENFANIGVQFPMIGKQLEESVNYVQNLGLNVRAVMNDVTQNMSSMNRYQFEGGIQGFTKMAAQASMLRFDMNETLRFADQMFRPEKAIQTAAAFQRLGVAAGDLVDPFQLMNQSINDPSGLQNSLINVSKQFTYFDEKTKSFKINPQGVLTLKEMSEELGLSFNEMTKMGLSAAELDRKLSSIRPNIQFDDEEDRKLLANIATMDSKTGDYKVSISDREGNVQSVRLSELTQEQTTKLIEQLKTPPKTMEQIATSQMTITQKILTAVESIKAGTTMGVASTDQIKSFIGSVSEITSAFKESLQEVAPDTPEVRGKLTSLASQAGQLIEALLKGGDKETITSGLKKLESEYGDVDTRVSKLIDDFTKNITDKLSDTQFDYTDFVKKQLNLKSTKKELQESMNRHKVDVTGKVDIDFMSTSNVFSGLSKKQIEEIIKTREFQEAFTKIAHEVLPEMYSKKQ